MRASVLLPHRKANIKKCRNFATSHKKSLRWGGKALLPPPPQKGPCHPHVAHTADPRRHAQGLSFDLCRLRFDGFTTEIVRYRPNFEPGSLGNPRSSSSSLGSSASVGDQNTSGFVSALKYSGCLGLPAFVRPRQWIVLPIAWQTSLSRCSLQWLLHAAITNPTCELR